MKRLLLAFVIVGMAAMVWLMQARQHGKELTAATDTAATNSTASNATTPAPAASDNSIAHSRPEPQQAAATPSNSRPAHGKAAMPHPRSTPPAGVALALLANLSSSASTGNAADAFNLWELLEECARVQAALSAGTTDVTTLVRDCDQVPQDEIERRLAWLEAAAEGGDLEAQLAYFGVASQQYNDPRNIAKNVQAFSAFQTKSLRYLTAAAEAGSVDAMVSLAMTYRDGTLGAVDPVREYAYLYAAAQTGLLQSAAAAATRAETALTAQQVQEGQILASRLLDLCCRSHVTAVKSAT